MAHTESRILRLGGGGRERSSTRRWQLRDSEFGMHLTSPYHHHKKTTYDRHSNHRSGYFIFETALSLSFLRSQLAQGFWLLCCCSPRGVVVCVVRGFAHFLSRAFKLTSFSIVRRTAYMTRIWYRSDGFLGGPSYQAGRLFSMEVIGLRPAAVSSVLAFLLLPTGTVAVSTATEYRCFSRGGV